MQSQNIGLPIRSGFTGSPTSEPASPSSPPTSPRGEKIGRAQAKKMFKDEVEQLVRAVKLIPTYAEAFSNLKRTEKLTVRFTDPHNQPREYQIGRSEYKEFVSIIVKGLQALPTIAFSLNKTRRRTAPNSGFLAPAQFSQEIVNFFATANIGNLVIGQMVEKKDKAQNIKMVPNTNSRKGQTLTETQTRLNTVLYFTQPQINGRENPLYGIISPGTLTPLFALHSYYARMQNPDDATRLSASLEMRRILRGVMTQTIDTDVRVISERYVNNPPLLARLKLLRQQLIAAIDNPEAIIESRLPTGQRRANGQEKFEEIFNPNSFLYAHFSKLISNGKLTGEQSLTENRLNAIRPLIMEVYGRNVPGISLQAFNNITMNTPQGQNPAYEAEVLQVQQNNVAYARAFKNQTQGTQQRQRQRRSTAENAAGGVGQRTTQQAPMNLTGVDELSLPAENILSNLQSSQTQQIASLPGNFVGNFPIQPQSNV